MELYTVVSQFTAFGNAGNLVRLGLGDSIPLRHFILGTLFCYGHNLNNVCTYGAKLVDSIGL